MLASAPKINYTELNDPSQSTDIFQYFFLHGQTKKKYDFVLFFLYMWTSEQQFVSTKKKKVKKRAELCMKTQGTQMHATPLQLWKLCYNIAMMPSFAFGVVFCATLN